MAARTIEAKLLLTGQDKGASAAINQVTKATAGLEKAAKVSAEVAKLTGQLGKLEASAKAVERVRQAGAAVGAAEMSFKMASSRARELASALDTAKKSSKGAEEIKGLTAQFQANERAVKGAASALAREEQAARAARSALNQLGVPIADLTKHQDALTRAISGTTKALQTQAREESRTAQARALAVQRRAEAEIRAQKQAELAAARSQEIRDARGALVGMAGIALGHKVHQATHATVHTYREFDKERRFGKAVMGLTDAEQKPLVDQAVHMGATTKYNDVQVLESQRELAARGLKKNQVLGLMEPAAALGMSLDLRLPDAVKQMEGALFGFKKDISTLDAALASARQTADIQVKAAKVSGMTPEDITQTYKYGATPARMAGLSEEMLLAFAAISKKANMGGDEAGVAFRALAANLLSPTRQAREVMLANGMDPKNYQKIPDKIDTNAFTKAVAAQYGVRLDRGTQRALNGIFTNKALIADPSKFTPAVMDLLSDRLGGDDAKSKKSIAGLANRFRAASLKGVDTNRMVEDLMALIAKNPAMANAFFGSKQGGRIANALADPKYFKYIINELRNHSEGYADKVSKERMAGFDGAMSRFEGAIKNLETAAGRAWDDDGNGGFLTGLTDAAAKATQALAELPRPVLQVGSALGYIGGKAATASGTIALVGSALALKGSAVALTAAAARIGGGVPSAPTSAAPAAGALAAGAVVGGVAVGGVAASVIANEAVKNKDFAAPYLDGGMLGADPGGYGLGAAIMHAPEIRKQMEEANRLAPRMALDPGQAPMTLGPGGGSFAIGRGSRAYKAGQEAGAYTVDGIVKGIQAEAPKAEEQGKSLFERLKGIFSEGIKVLVTVEGGDGLSGASGSDGLKGGMGSDDLSGSGGGSGSGGSGGGGIRRGLRVGTGAGAGGTVPVGGASGGFKGGPGLSKHARNVDPRMAAYIRHRAASLGIDPEVALRVASFEGLGGSKAGEHMTPGDYRNGRPTSWGPFQLHLGGRGSVGTEYQRATGHHPSDATKWKENIDFALKWARRHGWAAWYGRGPAGVGVRQGIGTYKGPVPEAMPDKAMPGEAATDAMNRTMPDGASFGPSGAMMDRMDQAVTRMAEMTWNSRHTVEVLAGPGVKARTRGMTATGSPGVKPNVGVSMPGAEMQNVG